MTRPDLPPTRDAKIARAREIIADLLDDGDQLDAEPVTSLEVPSLVTFTVQVSDEPRAWELCEDVSEAILNDGFGGISFGAIESVEGGDACRVTINVPVGAP